MIYPNDADIIVEEDNNNNFLVEFYSSRAKHWTINNIVPKSKWKDGKLIVDKKYKEHFMLEVFNNDFETYENTREYNVSQK